MRSSRRRVDLVLREARLQGHLGQQGQRRLQPGARHLDAGRHAVPAGIGGQLRAQPLGRLDQPDRIAPPRAFAERARHQHGHAAELGRLGRHAAARLAADDQLRGQQRPAGHVRRDQLQAVVQVWRSNRGKWYSRGEARRWAAGPARPGPERAGRGHGGAGGWRRHRRGTGLGRRLQHVLARRVRVAGDGRPASVEKSRAASSGVTTLPVVVAGRSNWLTTPLSPGRRRRPRRARTSPRPGCPAGTRPRRHRGSAPRPRPGSGPAAR